MVSALVALSVPLAFAATVASQRDAAAAGPDPQGTIYVADYGPIFGTVGSIDVFAAGANGNVAPIRTIVGPLTGLANTADVKVDSTGDVYASNFGNDSITEYAPGASGNVAPICTISGSNTGLLSNDDISLAPDGTLYVGNLNSNGTNSVEVFAPGVCGNIAPLRVIGGPLTGLSNHVDGLGVDATGTLYADNTERGANSIQVFAPGANGNVAPVRTIAGSLTGLGGPDDIIVGFTGEIFVTNGFGTGTNSVTVFAPGANGNVAPIQDISGSNTGFGNPDDLALDAGGNIFVTDASATSGPSVLQFASGANGNVAPMTTIAGSLTTLVTPEGVAVAGAPAPSLTTTTASSITLGTSTHDTATLSGGTSPTGSLIFKLFGPSDPTCSAAPAYTSPFSTISGNGNYTSPSFMPTALGSYSWVALYSGDTNNAPVSTACVDPNEAVMVTEVVSGDTTPPSCTLTAVIPGPPKQVKITVQDLESGLQSITVTKNVNATVDVPAFTPGTKAPVVVTGTKTDQTKGAQVGLRATDVAGNVTNCDPELLTIKPGGVQRIRDVPSSESRLTVSNGSPGLRTLRVTVNGKTFEIGHLRSSEVRVLDISSAMVAGSHNTITIRGYGRRGSSADVVLSD